ncbi:hypothetical protein Ancab_004182 [Ancistrocladus abbreviatus]
MKPGPYRPNSSQSYFPSLPSYNSQFPSYKSQYPSSSETPHLFFNPPNFSRNLINHYEYDEQALRDEVIYLHSLWRQGPPASLSTPISRNPTLKPSLSTPCKKKKKKKKKPVILSNKEWPVKPEPDAPSTSGSAWPDFKRVLTPLKRPASAEEVASVMAMRAQQKGLYACCEFFDSDDGQDDDDDDDDDEGEQRQEEGGIDDGHKESEEFQFFWKVFEGDEELRGYYEKHYENGEFCCLVCAGIGQKLRKKYVNCVALVQHCITISKTKKRRAHRTFGQVICKVLGWDIERLPTFVPPAGDPSGQSLKEPCVLETCLKRDDVHNDLEGDQQGGSGSGASAEGKNGQHGVLNSGTSLEAAVTGEVFTVTE